MRKFSNKSESGFTLIELMVVITIVALAAGLTLGYLTDSRKKGADTGIKSNLQTVRALSEIFYLDNANSYLPAGGSTLLVGPCPAYSASGTNMFARHKVMNDAVTEAIKRGNGGACANSGDFWAIAVGLNLNPGTSWCVDNQGSVKVVNATPQNSINPSTFLCN